MTPTTDLRWKIWRGKVTGRWHAQLFVIKPFESFEEAWAWIDIQRNAEPS